jgi:HD-like signal output (HDOD) protein
MVRVPRLAREIADRAAKQLHLPDAYLRLRQAMGKPNSSLGDLSRAVTAEPVMAGRMLGVVNSALGVGRELDDVSRTVSLLGVRNVYDIALVAAAATAFEEAESRALDLDLFWRRSVGCSLMARELGRRQGPDTERVYIAALLADLGNLLLDSMAPESVHAQFVRIPPWQPDTAERQLEEIGCHHAQVAAALLDAWSLPQEVVDCVLRHPAPMDGGPLPDELCITHICARVADAFVTGELREALLDGIAGDTMQDCGLQREDLAPLHEAARQHLDAVLDAVFPRLQRCA